jgi:hypothetical protein
MLRPAAKEKVEGEPFTHILFSPLLPGKRRFYRFLFYEMNPTLKWPDEKMLSIDWTGG